MMFAAMPRIGPIVRVGADGERVLVMARWGMSGPPPEVDRWLVEADTSDALALQRPLPER